MKILVACEFSGELRRRLRLLGHNAWSCDLEPAQDDSPFHLQVDLMRVLDRNWDAIIAFPPCTHLCISGARWWASRQKLQKQAIEFVKRIWNTDCPRICIENPIGILGKVLGPKYQVIQPWMHGHGETKATCLWLKGLPFLKPTNIVEKREPKILNMSRTRNRSKNRSRTYPGIAEAMALQWFGEFSKNS